MSWGASLDNNTKIKSWLKFQHIQPVNTEIFLQKLKVFLIQHYINSLLVLISGACPVNTEIVLQKSKELLIQHCVIILVLISVSLLGATSPPFPSVYRKRGRYWVLTLTRPSTDFVPTRRQTVRNLLYGRLSIKAPAFYSKVFQWYLQFYLLNFLNNVYFVLFCFLWW